MGACSLLGRFKPTIAAIGTSWWFDDGKLSYEASKGPHHEGLLLCEGEGSSPAGPC